jgi:hypothetical protein
VDPKVLKKAINDAGIDTKQLSKKRQVKVETRKKKK